MRMNMLVTSKFVRRIGMRNTNSTRNKMLIVSNLKLWFVNGIINEFKPSISPTIIIIVRMIDIIGDIFALFSLNTQELELFFMNTLKAKDIQSCPKEW